MSDQREEDIQRLCTAVIDNAAQYQMNPRGPDFDRCVFCGECDNTPTGTIAHSANCAYLIAKDLSTGATK